MAERIYLTDFVNTELSSTVSRIIIDTRIQKRFPYKVFAGFCPKQHNRGFAIASQEEIEGEFCFDYMNGPTCFRFDNEHSALIFRLSYE